MKKIDLKKSVADLCGQYPEIKDIMYDLGFKDIVKPVAMKTVGKVMTIPKGAEIKGIDLSQIIKALKENGFVIEGEDKKPGKKTLKKEEKSRAEKDMSRQELLKSYINRLSEGEDLESVRKDFVANFEHVKASEIAKAEQELIMEGTPVEEVQKLCDVHSALFHDRTSREQGIMKNLESAEKSIEEYQDIKGHPVTVLFEENKQIQEILDKAKISHLHEDMKAVSYYLGRLQKIGGHYDKKGDLIYPVLNKDYGFSGPADVMWGVDDEIRDEVKLISKSQELLDDFFDRSKKLIERTEEMIYKENNILLPLIINNFTEEDFMEIYYELPNYTCLLKDGSYPVWEEAEDKREDLKIIGGKRKKDIDQLDISDEKIVLGSGLMTQEEILAVLNTVPMELTFVDKNDQNSFFNDDGKTKLFKRPDAAIGRAVHFCHPPKVNKMAMEIIQSFRDGEKDMVHIPMVKEGSLVSVKYIAVRNENGDYLGTLECVQNLEEFRNFFKNNQGKED